MIVANKLDMSGSDPPELAELGRELNTEVMGISAVSGAGLEPVVNRLWQMLEEQKASEAAAEAKGESSPKAQLDPG